MAAAGRRDYQQPSLEDDGDLIDPDDADLNDFDDPIESNNPRAPLTGNIGQSTTTGGPSSSSRPLNQSYLTSRIPGDDRAVAYNNTIDEPVWATLRRDLLAIWGKLREVLWPRYLFGGTMFEPGLQGAYAGLRGDQGEGGASLLGNARDELGTLAGRVLDPEALLSANNMTPGLRDWDLWGPLLFSLLLSVLLTINRSDQKDEVFSGVFAMVWIGEAVVTLQIKLLGGNISFAQSVSIIGYTLFPLVIAAFLSAVHLWAIARIPIYLFLIAWSLAAGVSILGGSGVVKNRVGLAVYPLFVYYIGLGCLCFIS